MMTHFSTEMSSTGASWIVEKSGRTLENQILECQAKNGVVYYYSAAFTTTDIPVGTVSDEATLRTFRLDICAPLALHNQLPITISYQSQIFSNDVDPGCHKFVKTISLNVQSKLKLTVSDIRCLRAGIFCPPIPYGQVVIFAFLYSSSIRAENGSELWSWDRRPMNLVLSISRQRRVSTSG